MSETTVRIQSVRATLAYGDGRLWPLPVFVDSDIHGDIPEVLIDPRDSMSEIAAGKWLLHEIVPGGVTYRQIQVRGDASGA
jgi:hypothetical protein